MTRIPANAGIGGSALNDFVNAMACEVSSPMIPIRFIGASSAAVNCKRPVGVRRVIGCLSSTGAAGGVAGTVNAERSQTVAFLSAAAIASHWPLGETAIRVRRP